MLVIFLYGCLDIFVAIGCNYEFMFSFNLNYFRLGLSLAMLYTVSQKTSKIIFVITTSNFHQIRQFLTKRWQIV